MDDRPSAGDALTRRSGVLSTLADRLRYEAEIGDISQGLYDAAILAAAKIDQTADWLRKIIDCDWNEIVADGGVTAAMVIQQEAREQLRRMGRDSHGIAPTLIEEFHMSKDKLLPCPFCGGEARRLTIGEEEPNNAGGDVIACSKCQASSHVEFGRKENLVSHWNTRASLRARTA